MWAYRSLGIGRWPHDFTDYAQFCITTNNRHCRFRPAEFLGRFAPQAAPLTNTSETRSVRYGFGAWSRDGVIAHSPVG